MVFRQANSRFCAEAGAVDHASDTRVHAMSLRMETTATTCRQRLQSPAGIDNEEQRPNADKKPGAHCNGDILRDGIQYRFYWIT
jgi:hypothetical protein